MELLCIRWTRSHYLFCNCWPVGSHRSSKLQGIAIGLGYSSEFDKTLLLKTPYIWATEQEAGTELQASIALVSFLSAERHLHATGGGKKTNHEFYPAVNLRTKWLPLQDIATDSIVSQMLWD